MVGNPTPEVRTDGGEVLPDPGQQAQQTPQIHGPQTPDSPGDGRPQRTETSYSPGTPTIESNSDPTINAEPYTGSTNTPNGDAGPTNNAEPYADSGSTDTPNGDQLFSGVVWLEDVVEFYLDTSPGVSNKTPSRPIEADSSTSRSSAQSTTSRSSERSARTR